MTIDAALELTDRECAELLKALSGPGAQTQKWYAVVRKAFAQGVERGSALASSEKLVEPLIDIAETVARAGVVPVEKISQRYGLFRIWAQEFQSEFTRRHTAGEQPAATYQADIERFALAKAVDWGIVRADMLTTSAAAVLAAPDVHRDFAIRYIEPEMLTGFVESLLNEAGVRTFELDQAVFEVSKQPVHAHASETDKQIASKSFAEVNSAGRSAQVEYVAARVGVQAAYEFALRCLDERDRDAHSRADRL